MKLYAPSYYKKFKCLADKCTHSCCVGWEIDIDQDTLKKYKNLNNDYKDAIIESISADDIPHFKLSDCDRCPHLDENGLCKIILNAGEGYLCDICREHPRFYNYTGVAEVGLGMSCMEAARIILTSTDYNTFDEIGELDVKMDDELFDPLPLRSEIFAILQDHTCNYKEKLDKIYRKFSIDMHEDAWWHEILDSLEYLDTNHKALFMNYSHKKRPDTTDEYLERFLAYFVYRHCTEAADPDDFCDRLSFCLFCERLFASLICHTNAKSLEELVAIAITISEELEYSEDNTFALTY